VSEMSKMCYFSIKFSKIAKRWELFALIFDFADIKLRNFAKLCFF